MTNDQAYEILKYYSLDLGSTGRDNDYGHGMPCFKDYSECTCNCENCDKIYCFGCSCATCKYHEPQPKTLTNIEITKMPNKTVYNEGEKFDPTGMEVTATYSDNTRAVITNYTYSPTGSLKTTDKKVTISYTEGNITKTAEINITVNGTPPPVEKNLTNIKITKMPNKTVYNEGEKFDPTGMEVTATYSDNTRAVITNYTYSPTGSLKTTDKKVTISYTEGNITKTAEINITVNGTPPPVEKNLTNIKITKMPNKTVYNEGEKFDPTGMEVTATYSDNTRAVITNYTYSPTGSLKTTDKKVTISYTEDNITKTAEINITVNAKPTPPQKILTNIEITKMPNKIVYKEGETFDKTGMVVTATYSDGSRENINNYNCFPITALTTNHTHITVTYTENGRTVTAKVQITVISNGNNTSDDDNNSNNNQGNTNQNNNSQTNTNQNNQNNNNQTNNNQVSINQNNNLVNKTNTTAKDGKIAQTGVETYIIPIIIISIIGAIGFIKYKQYRDI